MKNIKFLSLFLFFFTLSAQDLDQAYLNSLPEDIRKDVLDRAEQNKEESKEKYRASVYSSR